MLVEAARRIDEARIELADIALRRPSLDHVFLAMTTDPTESLTHLVSGSAR
ncbi:daunorubicin-dim-transport ATP-binding protein ABC transporter drrA [Mycobacterium tuberculosis]|nr:daunorubicin-dim-transport ATP-binding protein ABC transporter drrA [Mycobacterium tuberculosis]